MTQLETRPEISAVGRGPSGSTPSDAPPSSPFWWIALSFTCLMLILGVVVFAVGLSSRDTVQPKAFADAQVTMSLADFKVTLPASNLTAGAKTLQITNGGTTPHELLVFQPDASIDPNHLPLADDGNINEEASGVNKVSDGDNIAPGESQTRQLDLSTPGRYVFLCNLPGHYKLGMFTVVTVK